MEFDEDMVALQGTLLSLQRREGCLKYFSMQDSAGILKIISVINMLEPYFRCEDRNDGSQWERRRKLAFYLILNTDLSVHEELKDDTNCGHAVGTTPILSQDLLVEAVWELGLQPEVADVVRFVPARLAVEVADCIALRVAVSPSASAFHHLSCLATCLYRKLALAIPKDSEQPVDADPVASTLYLHFCKLVRMFVPSVDGSKEEAYDSIGMRASAVMSLLQSCVECLQEEDNSEKVPDMYNITLKHPVGTTSPCNPPSGKNILAAANNELLEVLKNVLSMVTCEMWVYFSDCPSLDEVSLQAELAGGMYRCMKLLRSCQCLHADKSQLTQVQTLMFDMASKRRSEEVLGSGGGGSGGGEILERLQGGTAPAHKKVWLKALLVCDSALTDPECVDCLREHAELLDTDDIGLLLEKVASTLARDTGGSPIAGGLLDILKEMALQALVSVPLAMQLQMLHNHMAKHGVSNTLICDNFQQRLTEVFNKAVTASGSDTKDGKMYGELVQLCFQSCENVVHKMLYDAVSTGKQLSFLLDVLKTLWPLRTLMLQEDRVPEGSSSSLLSRCLCDVLSVCEWNDTEQASCVAVVIALIKESVVSGSDFLNKCLFPNLHSCLVDKKWTKLMLWLQVLEAFVTGTVSHGDSLNHAVLLVVLAQIIEVCNMTLFTFTHQCLCVRDKVRVLINSVLNTFLSQDNIEELSVVWLEQELRSFLSPHNVSYFWKLWQQFNMEPPQGLEHAMLLIHGLAPKTEGSDGTDAEANIERDRVKFVCTLLRHLPCSCTDEWKTIAASLKSMVRALPTGHDLCFYLFDLFADAIILLACTTSQKCSLSDVEMACVIACLDHCMRNFGVIVLEDVLRQEGMPLSLSGGCSMFEKCVTLYVSLPVALQESCSGTFIGLLAEVAACTAACDAGADAGTSKEPIRKELLGLASRIDHEATRQAVSTKVVDVCNA